MQKNLTFFFFYVKNLTYFPPVKRSSRFSVEKILKHNLYGVRFHHSLNWHNSKLNVFSVVESKNYSRQSSHEQTDSVSVTTVIQIGSTQVNDLCILTNARRVREKILSYLGMYEYKILWSESYVYTSVCNKSQSSTIVRYVNKENWFLIEVFLYRRIFISFP